MNIGLNSHLKPVLHPIFGRVPLYTTTALTTASLQPRDSDYLNQGTRDHGASSKNSWRSFSVQSVVMSLSEAAQRPREPQQPHPPPRSQHLQSNGRSESSEDRLSSTPPISPPEIEVKSELEMSPNMMMTAASSTSASNNQEASAPTASTPGATSKSIQNNNTSSYTAGGRLKFFKGKIFFLVVFLFFLVSCTNR